MTRRDYCGKCSKLVHDNDVMCCQCHVSLCSGCITPYDWLAFTCMISSRLNVYCKPYLLTRELFELHEIFSRDDVKEYIINAYIGPANAIHFDLSTNEICFTSVDNDNENDNDTETNTDLYNNYLSNLTNVVNKYKSLEDAHVNLNDINVVKQFFKDMEQDDCFDFVCYMCHRGIKVQY